MFQKLDHSILEFTEVRLEKNTKHSRSSSGMVCPWESLEASHEESVTLGTNSEKLPNELI